MKKIIYSIFLFAATILYTSCDALDLAPEDYYGSSSFWTKKAHVEGFMNGIHSQLRDRYSMFYILGELRGGTQRTGSSSQNTSLDYEKIRLNLINKDDTGVTNWNGLYVSIMQINHFIQKVENECEFLSKDDRNYYLGEAYGLRSLYYFMLYKTYGGVPLVTEVELLNGKVTADKFYIARSTPQETMTFVKENIKKSEDYFNAATEGDKITRTMWSKYATLMLKAEIHMWASKVSIQGYTASGREDLVVAQTALKEIEGKFELEKDFSKIFSTANRNNNEIIFTLHFEDKEATNWGGAFLYQEAVFINQVYDRKGALMVKDTLNLQGTGGVFRHEYKEAFWKSYDNKDTRRDATFMEYYTDKELTKFGCVMKKGLGSINSTNNRIYDADIIVYRYADYLLMRAEVENGLGNPCANYINAVRERAYGDNYSKETYGYTDNSNFAENELAILHERDKEFVWEGKRWFDVIRLQDANHQSLVFSEVSSYPVSKALLDKATESYKLLWPIDVNTLTVNNLLEQTPGYEVKKDK